MALSGSPVISADLRSSSPRGVSTRDWEELSSALLEDGFILTALELYTELLEAGKDVVSLKDYFSNPGNFENALPHLPATSLLNTMSKFTDAHKWNVQAPCPVLIMLNGHSTIYM